MSKKYLAFLGTSKYTECYYVFEQTTRIRCHFVQEALTRILCQEWTADDEVIIFTTSEAKKKNWKSGYFNEEWIGLEQRFNESNYACRHKQIDVPDGNSEQALWEIFDIVFQELQEGDEIIFDITHAFRSLPMLALIILNYAKTVKNCTLAGIYYGAFEVLGTAKDVEQIAIDARNAPIFDLTPFVALLDWTVGIDRFLKTGDASDILALTSAQIDPLRKASEGKNYHAAILDSMAKAMHAFALNAATCRGKELSRSALNVKSQIANALTSSLELAKPLHPLLQKTQQHFETYQADHDTANLFHVVKWCRDHQLIQQGLTLLEESFLTDLCRKLRVDIENITYRQAVSKAISIIARPSFKREQEFYQIPLPFTIDDVRAFLPSAAFVSAFESLRKARNDMNHAGFKPDQKQSKQFKKTLDDLLQRFEQEISAL